ncbi:hypothetical protein [Sporosarcina cascadiensis]|uniref:hypothetical protein n=1 Tax=Sporosarcina cascadiensis TaxID=2660747 RepID=UPI00129A1407|nr:hypothetical protein [Sporosarcina cascadiensis]
MEKRTDHVDLILTTAGLGLVSLLLLVADKLLEPIKGKDICGLEEDMFRGLLQLENVEHLYNPFIHLFIPLVLVILSFVLSVIVCISLCKSMRTYDDSLLAIILKSLFIVIFLFLIVVTGRVAWILMGL